MRDEMSETPAERLARLQAHMELVGVSYSGTVTARLSRQQTAMLLPVIARWAAREDEKRRAG